MRKRQGSKSFGTLSVILLALAVVVSGCIAPADPEPPPNPRPDPVIVSPPDDEPARDLTLEVSAEASLVATLYELLGDSGTLTVNPAAPIVLRRPEATLTISPGSRLSYELSPTGGAIRFTEPRPTVSVRKWGLKLSPRLARLDLSADNTGTAHVESGPIKFSKRFSLSWDETDPAGQSIDPPPLPVVRMFSATWCGPCQAAHQALDRASAAGELPFRIEYVPEPHPFPASLPYFEWRDIHGERFGIQGWNGLEELVRRWRLTEATADGQAAAWPRWSFPGSSRGDLIDHLKTHPNHRSTFSSASLDGLSFDDLVDLHSRHHNEASTAGDRSRPRRHAEAAPALSRPPGRPSIDPRNRSSSRVLRPA